MTDAEIHEWVTESARAIWPGRTAERTNANGGSGKEHAVDSEE